MQYFALKALHIVSVVVFLGNIITGFFWKIHADRMGELRARAQALDGLIRADRGPLQKQLLANTRAGLAGNWNEAEYHALSKAWGRWGTVATAAPLGALILMVFKPA